LTSEFHSSDDVFGIRAEKVLIDAYSRRERAREEIVYKRQSRSNFVANTTNALETLKSNFILKDKIDAKEYVHVQQGQKWLLSRRILLYCEQLSVVNGYNLMDERNIDTS